MIPAAFIYRLAPSIGFPMLFSMLYGFIKTHYSYFMHKSMVFPRGFTLLYAYYSLLCIFYARFMHKFGVNIALCTLYMSVFPVNHDTLWGGSCALWTYGHLEIGGLPFGNLNLVEGINRPGSNICMPLSPGFLDPLHRIYWQFLPHFHKFCIVIPCIRSRIYGYRKCIGV